MGAHRESRPDQIALDIEANAPRLQRAMSALGLTGEGERPAVLARSEPEPPIKFDNGSRRVKFRRVGGRWAIYAEGFLPRAEFDRFVRCLRAGGAEFGRHGQPKGEWTVAHAHAHDVSYNLINSGFSTDVVGSEAAPPPPPGSLASTCDPPGVLGGAA